MHMLMPSSPCSHEVQRIEHYSKMVISFFCLRGVTPPTSAAGGEVIACHDAGAGILHWWHVGYLFESPFRLTKLDMRENGRDGTCVAENGYRYPGRVHVKAGGEVLREYPAVEKLDQSLRWFVMAYRLEGSGSCPVAQLEPSCQSARPLTLKTPCFWNRGDGGSDDNDGGDDDGDWEAVAASEASDSGDEVDELVELHDIFQFEQPQGVLPQGQGHSPPLAAPLWRQIE